MVDALVVLNAGSSSLKFQLFEERAGAEPTLLFRGLVEGIGGAARFVVKAADGETLSEHRFDGATTVSHEDALDRLICWMRDNAGGRRPSAVAHRIVHGGDLFQGPTLLTESVVRSLEALVPLAPLHQPFNLEPVRVIRRMLPELPQIGCFDTAFHRTQSDVARAYALPRTVRERGVKRYGFHGLSYDYIASTLASHDPRLAAGRTVVAHLGNGASLCALDAGRSVASSMGFSALDGIPMGTRSGALDPAIVFFLMRDMKLSPDEAEKLLYTRSGLLGLSELSNDMRRLREAAPNNPQARFAIDVFVYRIVREIGSMMAALGGIDGLVFTGGIGENDAATRREVLAALGWAGFQIDEAGNAGGGPCITAPGGASAWVIPTNEEIIAARQARQVLADQGAVASS
jgi:acetate kinase